MKGVALTTHFFVGLQISDCLQEVMAEADILGDFAKANQSWLGQIHHQPKKKTEAQLVLIEDSIGWFALLKDNDSIEG